MPFPLSPFIYSSSLHHGEYRYPLLHDVEIQSLNDDDCAFTRNGPIRFEYEDLTLAIAGKTPHATKRRDHEPGWDSLDPTSRPMRPTLHVRIQEIVFHFESAKRVFKLSLRCLGPCETLGDSRLTIETSAYCRNRYVKPGLLCDNRHAPCDRGKPR
jgi:hypothetical protein